VARFGYRVVVEGVVTFAHTGERFDALYRAGKDGDFARRHDLLAWSPAPLEPVRADRVAHRYEYLLPREWEGQSAGLRFNTDRLVAEFLIPPSEVATALSGSLKFTLLRVPLAPPSLLGLIGAAAVPVVLGGGGLAFVLHRRRLFMGLAPDLRLQAERLEQKYRVARAAVSAEQNRMLPLAQRLSDLRAGGHRLIRRVQHLRQVQAVMDRREVAAELNALHQQLSRLTEERARREGELALQEKRKSLVLLDALAASESECTLRLQRIESLLGSASLSLRYEHLQNATRATETIDEALCRDLDAELSALREVSGEIVFPDAPYIAGLTRPPEVRVRQ
jgi:hypothetical protein